MLLLGVFPELTRDEEFYLGCVKAMNPDGEVVTLYESQPHSNTLLAIEDGEEWVVHNIAKTVLGKFGPEGNKTILFIDGNGLVTSLSRMFNAVTFADYPCVHHLIRLVGMDQVREWGLANYPVKAKGCLACLTD